jgi:hypothetical protein
MNRIPLTSQFSLFKGIWFVFRDGDREIAHHNSILGLERIFINGKLIFKKRILSQISKTNKRQFTFEGNLYEVLILISKVQTTQIECSLVKDGVHLDKLKAYYKLDGIPIPVKKQLVLCLPGAILTVYFAIFFNIPFWLYLPILVISVYAPIITYMIKKHMRLIVEKIDIHQTSTVKSD